MLEYNQIKERAYIVLDGNPYEVLESNIAKKNRQKPVNQTKVRNLITGSVKQVSFHQSDKIDEAEIEKKKVTYLFQKFNKQNRKKEYWFYEGSDKGARFQLDEDLIGNKILYIKENEQYDALIFNEQIFGIDIPIKIYLEVIEAPPAVRGNTATGANKIVKLETGLEVSTPLFINEGDILSINTETGSYVERKK